MNEEQVVEIARQAVKAKGGVLVPRWLVRQQRRWIWFGRRYWSVMSNLPRKGNNWVVTIDAESGDVLSVWNMHQILDARHRRRRRPEQ